MTDSTLQTLSAAPPPPPGKLRFTRAATAHPIIESLERRLGIPASQPEFNIFAVHRRVAELEIQMAQRTAPPAVAAVSFTAPQATPPQTATAPSLEKLQRLAGSIFGATSATGRDDLALLFYQAHLNVPGLSYTHLAAAGKYRLPEERMTGSRRTVKAWRQAQVDGFFQPKKS